MEQRTCNIIMCCKKHGEGDTALSRIVNYMSKECDCPKETYLDFSLLFSIIKEAFIDYASTCDHIRVLLFNYYEGAKFYSTELERMIGALSVVQVISGDTYINGFNVDLIEKSKQILGD